MASLGSVCFALLILYFLETKFSLDKRIKIFLGLSSALILWLLLSSFFGADPTTSFWSNFGRHTGVLTYFFGFIFFLSAVFIYNKETFFVPLQAFVLGGALATLSIYLGPALLDVDLLFLTTSAGGGTFGNTTYAGIFLVFSLFSALILFFRENVKNRKLFWIFCFFFILLNPIFLNIKEIFSGNINNLYSLVGEARAGFISIFIGAFLSLIFYFYFSNKKTHAVLAKILLSMKSQNYAKPLWRKKKESDLYIGIWRKSALPSAPSWAGVWKIFRWCTTNILIRFYYRPSIRVNPGLINRTMPF